MATRKHDGPDYFGRVPRSGQDALFDVSHTALAMYVALTNWGGHKAFDPDGFSLSDRQLCAILHRTWPGGKRSIERARTALQASHHIDSLPGTGQRPTWYRLIPDPAASARAAVEKTVDDLGAALDGGDKTTAPGAAPPTPVRPSKASEYTRASSPPRFSTAPDPAPSTPPEPPPQGSAGERLVLTIPRHKRRHVLDPGATRARCAVPVDPRHPDAVPLGELVAFDLHNLAPWCLLCWQLTPELYDIVDDPAAELERR